MAALPPQLAVDSFRRPPALQTWYRATRYRICYDGRPRLILPAKDQVVFCIVETIRMPFGWHFPLSSVTQKKLPFYLTVEDDDCHPQEGALHILNWSYALLTNATIYGVVALNLF